MHAVLPSKVEALYIFLVLFSLQFIYLNINVGVLRIVMQVMAWEVVMIQSHGAELNFVVTIFFK